MLCLLKAAQLTWLFLSVQWVSFRITTNGRRNVNSSWMVGLGMPKLKMFVWPEHVSSVLDSGL